MSAPETHLACRKAREHPIMQLAHAALVLQGRGVGAGFFDLLVVARGGGVGGGGLDGRGVGAGGGHCGGLWSWNGG
jgi:hypothetical protein